MLKRCVVRLPVCSALNRLPLLDSLIWRAGFMQQGLATLKSQNERRDKKDVGRPGNKKRPEGRFLLDVQARSLKDST